MWERLACCRPYAVLERSMQAWFSQVYGRVVARHPVRIILVGLLVTVACGSGLLFFDTSLTEQINDWVPRGSTAWRDRGELLDVFPSTQGRGNVLVVLRTRSATQSIASQANLEAAFDVYDHITRVAKSGTDRFEDVCLVDRTATGCTLLSLFSTLNVTSVDQVDQDSIVAFLRSGQIDVSAMFGEITLDDEGKFESARSLGQGFPLDMPVVDQSKRDAGFSFMQLLDDYLTDTDNKDDDLDVVWYTVSFESSELDRTVRGELPLVLGSALIIFVLLMAVLGGRPPRKSRLLLGTAIVVVVVMDLAIIFGICGWTGIPLTVISMLMAFVMLGIGVDDIIIVTRCLDSASHLPDLEDAMGLAMERAGFPIFITSWSSFVAFLGGSFVDIPAISWFCLTGVFGVVGMFFLTLTVFAGCLVLDERRRRANRFDCLVCCGGSSSPKGSVQSGAAANGEELEARGASQPPPEPTPEPGPPAADPPAAESRSLTARMLSRVADAMTHPKYGRLVCLSIIVGFVVLFVAAFLFATDDPDTTMNSLELFPDDSRVHDMVEWSDSMSLGGDPTYVVVQRQDYSDAGVQSRLLGTLEDAETQEEIVLLPFVCWLCALGNYANATDRSDELSGAGFYGLLDDFLATPQFTYVDESGMEQTDNGTSYSIDLRWQDGEIVASRFLFRFRPTNDLSRDIAAVAFLREAVGSRFDNGLVWTEYFGVADREATTLDTIKQSLMLTAGFTTVALFLVLHPGLALLLAVGVVLIDVDIIGFAVLWGMALDGLALTCIIMAIGLSIDYLIHIGHAFVIEQGSAEERLRASYARMGTSVFLGGLTTFAGVCLTAAAQSVAFRTFFKMLFLTTLFGVLHGVFLAPTLLYLVFAHREKRVASSKAPA